MIEFYENTWQLAKRAGIGRRKLRRWLREKQADGHPLLADHDKGTRYWFLPADSAALAAEYRAEH